MIPSAAIKREFQGTPVEILLPERKLSIVVLSLFLAAALIAKLRDFHG